jgi:hypothetical protein
VRGVRVFCVCCGQTSALPSDVKEALEYHGRELVLDSDGWHEIWDVCRDCCDYYSSEEWRDRVDRAGHHPSSRNADRA